MFLVGQYVRFAVSGERRGNVGRVENLWEEGSEYGVVVRAVYIDPTDWPTMQEVEDNTGVFKLHNSECILA